MNVVCVGGFEIELIEGQTIEVRVTNLRTGKSMSRWFDNIDTATAEYLYYGSTIRNQTLRLS